MFRNRRIARSLAALLAISALQTISGIQAPYSLAAAGTVGSTTASGTCVSNVGETTYVTATFVNNAFCLIKVSTSTSWTVPSGVNTIDILVVGGGGGGGSDGGGGGGGGEVRTATGISVSAGISATVTVGTGGIGNIHGQTNATNGNTSSLVINGTTYSAGGGLKAVNWQSAAYYAPGGSGGTGGTQLTGATDYSKGGRNSVQNDGYAAGGYGTVGYAGVTTSFTGTSTVFAGGGGGGICTNTKSEATFGGLAGGAGGGGRGALHTQNVGSDAGQPGTNGLGGGGGGGSACNDGLNDGVTSRTAGGRGGDGVVYIKFVPVPAVSTNPTSTTAEVGSAATFTAATQGTIAGATRSVKWQVLTPGGSWADISGATSDTYLTPATTRTMHGNQYRYVTTDTVGTISSSSYSTAATLTVIAPAQGETDTALNSSDTQYASVSSFTPIMPGTVSTYTIEAWINPGATCEGNYYCSIVANNFGFLLDVYAGKIAYIIGSGSAWCDSNSLTYPTSTAVKTGEWSHVALVRNGANVKIYINGNLRSDVTSSCNPTTQATNTAFFGVGYRASNSQYFYGNIDEVRMWSTTRTSTNILSDMHSNETSTSGLLNYWNFNEGTGAVAYNQVPGASEGTDLAITGSGTWNSTSVTNTSTSGAYTVQTFNRSVITRNGGWKVPSNVKLASVLVVGGGGGGAGQGYSTDTGGGGGGGGVYEIGTYPLSSGTVVRLVVGMGGQGGLSVSPNRNSLGRVGGTTRFDQLTAGGGGGATYESSDVTINAGSGTAGGGGGGASYYLNASTFGAGGTGTDLTIGGVTYSGRTGGNAAGYSGSTSGGGGGAGGAASGSTPGAGITSSITGVTYGRGGMGGGGTSFTYTSPAAAAGNGGDGYSSGNSVFGVNGANGLVVVRWITAAKPIFTQPTNDTTTAGLFDTMTVSANPISPLTRNYQWQVSTDTGTTWSNAVTGSGANSYIYTTPTLETTTSGIRYQYRVVVTDSDTAGLYIVDTSTAVYLIINPRITYTGSYTVQKYGTTHQDTFTVSNGTGTKSFTFSPNNRSGITWSTPSSNNAVLTIGSTLSPGTYYETATATDSKGAQVTIGLSILVNKADTLTVNVVSISDTYTGSALTFTPRFTVTGLQNSDTITAGSVSWSYNGVENSGTLYAIQSTKPVNAGSYVITPTVPSLTDTYTAVTINPGTLTVNRATRTLTLSSLVTPLKFGSFTTFVSTPSAGAGDGTVTYSTSTTDSCTVSSVSLRAVKSSGVCYASGILSRGNNFETATSNTVSTTLMKADTLTVTVDSITAVTYTGLPANVSPTVTVTGLKNSNTVGASPATISYSAGDTSTAYSTTIPTDADTYTVRASALTLTSGSLSDYQGVTYVDGSLRINRAQQSQLFIAQFGAVFGTPYKVIVFGGSGTGAVTETVTAGTASGCTISGDTLTSTTEGTCFLSATKARDKNYETATATAYVYFLLWVAPANTPAPSSGPGMALSGATAVTLDPNQAPTISSLSVSSGRVGDTVVITGAGFTASTLQSVKFWRNILATVTGTTTNSQITVIVPAGATTGKILVTTANGLAITEGSFTVLP